MFAKVKPEILAVLAMYRIKGEHLRAVKDTVGVVNETYFIFDGNKKWVLRKSSAQTTLEHLRFEQKLLAYLPKHGFKLAPRAIRNKYDQTITRLNKSLFTVQEFLPGKIVGSWNDVSRFTKPRVDAFFKMIAEFSKATKYFIREPNTGSHTLWWHVQRSPRQFQKIVRTMPASAGKNLLVKNRKNILSFFSATKEQFIQTKYDALRKQVVHFDWHLGNVHFNGNTIVGVFDFDWAQFDCRLTDVANAICMSCYYYGGPKDGQFRKDIIKCAPQSYRESYGKSEYDAIRENELIKVAVRGCALFQFLWAGDFYKSKPSAQRLVILKHFLKMLLDNDYDGLFS